MRPALAAAVATLLAAAGPVARPAAAQTVTIGFTFGPGDAATFSDGIGPPQGQTFVVPIGFPVLQEFRWYVGTARPSDAVDPTLAFEIHAWDGSAPVGGAVASVPLPFAPTNLSTPIFSGALPLVAGEAYVALIVGGNRGVGTAGYDPSGADRYADGTFVFFDGAAWQTMRGADGPFDTYFMATFGTTAVPEPATVTLVGAGLVGIATLARRRRGRPTA